MDEEVTLTLLVSGWLIAVVVAGLGIVTAQSTAEAGLAVIALCLLLLGGPVLARDSITWKDATDLVVMVALVIIVVLSI